jgi:hypothetical protein
VVRRRNRYLNSAADALTQLMGETTLRLGERCEQG